MLQNLYCSLNRKINISSYQPGISWIFKTVNDLVTESAKIYDHLSEYGAWKHELLKNWYFGVREHEYAANIFKVSWVSYKQREKNKWTIEDFYSLFVSINLVWLVKNDFCAFFEHL